MAAGGVFVAYRVTRHVDQPLVVLSDELETNLTLDGSQGSAIAISPDGSRIAYVTADDARVTHLSMRKLDDAKSTALADTEGADGPFFSPDGRWIGFFTPKTLKKCRWMEARPSTSARSRARSSAAAARGPRTDQSWLRVRARRYCASGLRVERQCPSRCARKTRSLDMGSSRARGVIVRHSCCRGGAAILFAATRNRESWEAATIEVQSLESGQRKTLVRGGDYPRYVAGPDRANGHLIYIHDDTMFAAPMNVARLELTGAARPILQEARAWRPMASRMSLWPRPARSCTSPARSWVARHRTGRTPAGHRNAGDPCRAVQRSAYLTRQCTHLHGDRSSKGHPGPVRTGAEAAHDHRHGHEPGRRLRLCRAPDGRHLADARRRQRRTGHLLGAG